MKKRFIDRMKEKLGTTPVRLGVAGAIGIVVGTILVIMEVWQFALIAAWDSAVLVYIIWVWRTVWSMDGRTTKSHAVREDPGRHVADVLLITASVASLGAILLLLLQVSRDTGMERATDIILGLASIVISWFLVHTTYMLKYARLFYGKPEGGVSFNEKDAPQYTDFAYLAFTLGMTFQVSDTNLTTKAIRVTALRHALLSYLFGTVIIATTINTLASLSH
jgi:uncharacterized membrane protein